MNPLSPTDPTNPTEPVNPDDPVNPMSPLDPTYPTIGPILSQSTPLKIQRSREEETTKPSPISPAQG